MAYNQLLAARVRTLLQEEPAFTEREMFGGIGFMLSGHMACGVIGDDIIIRVGADGYEDALAEPHTKPFATTGRPMRGWVMIPVCVVEAEEALSRWVARGVSFVHTLPAK